MSQELQTQEQTGIDNSMLVFNSKDNFENAQRMAKVLYSSSIVPKQYQGQTNMSNCIIALEMANRIGMSPLMVMQNLYIVHGNPGWSSKFLIAALNVSGRFSPLRYEFRGEEGSDDWGCRAWATDNTGEKLYGAWVTMKMAKAEGWYSKTGSKWQTMPELMMQYRAGAFFARTFAPEIGMGLQTSEELYDTGSGPIEAEFRVIESEPVDELDTPDKVNDALLKGQIDSRKAGELLADIDMRGIDNEDENAQSDNLFSE